MSRGLFELSSIRKCDYGEGAIAVRSFGGAIAEARKARIEFDKVNLKERVCLPLT